MSRDSQEFRWILFSVLLSFGAVAVLLIASYLLRQELRTWTLSKDQSDFWDTLSKSVTGALAIASAYIAAWKFLDDKEKTTQAAIATAYKPFSEKQQAVYFELIEAASTIANRSQTASEYVRHMFKEWSP